MYITVKFTLILAWNGEWWCHRGISRTNRWSLIQLQRKKKAYYLILIFLKVKVTKQKKKMDKFISMHIHIIYTQTQMVK